ncbi:MAG TPA: DUF4019 domain-containing protein [Rhizomicrobium sp.]|nr:DUF4019 domain-containing protein [Rhizomicrobium sp.]
MKWSVIFFALALAAPASATPARAQAIAQATPARPPAAGAVGPATPLTPAPDDRAKQWLNLVDDQNYNDAYQQMSRTAQTKTTASAWAARVSQTREPMGAMASRNLKAVRLTHILPGMSDGQYATVEFDSSFAHKGAAVETVTLISDKGAWSVIGYTVN